MISIDLSILNQKGTPMFYSDTLALRPTFGIAGRIFIDIASPYGIYRDTGTSWVQIAVGSAGSGTIGGGGTINTIAMFTPNGVSVGDSALTQTSTDVTIAKDTIVNNGNLTVSDFYTSLSGAINPYGAQISSTNTFNAGITWTALLACFNTSSLMNNNWGGSAIFGNGSYTANNLILNSFTFTAAGATITNDQATGLRTWANQILQLRINGTNNGTFTHYANSAIYGDFASGSARFTFTNRYGYLVNDFDEYSAGHTYTNRWAFYNAGPNDNNYFAGKTILTVKFNRQTASYTLVESDRSRMVEMNVATANNLTVPLNSSVPFEIGTQIEVAQYGAGQTTIVGASGVTIRSASGNLKIASQYVGVSIIKIGTDEWYVFGNLSA
jgi:hypothetical protein